ncbi:MAG TPA: hypothetical protein VKC66_00295 [Xanthobacteraceae bacterium]|nr:hypothetical protein [Xanthobacteraceae bacterium]
MDSLAGAFTLLKKTGIRDHTGLGIKNDQIDLQGIGITTSKKDEARVSFTEAASNLDLPAARRRHRLITR